MLTACAKSPYVKASHRLAVETFERAQQAPVKLLGEAGRLCVIRGCVSAMKRDPSKEPMESEQDLPNSATGAVLPAEERPLGVKPQLGVSDSAAPATNPLIQTPRRNASLSHHQGFSGLQANVGGPRSRSRRRRWCRVKRPGFA